MSVCWKLKYARTMCNINTRCLHDTVDICISFIQGFLLNLIVSFSTNSSLVGPCSLASLFHALPPCWSSYRSSFNRSSIFSGLRRRSYAKQAKLRHYPLANQRFLRSVLLLPFFLPPYPLPLLLTPATQAKPRHILVLTPTLLHLKAEKGIHFGWSLPV